MGNEPVKNKVSLSDKLAIIGILVGVISVVVAVFFGYLTLNPPAPPPTETPTPGPSPTAAPPGTVFFQDDLENGAGLWNTSDAWEVREDELGNHMLCAAPKGQNYSFVVPRAPTPWSNYIFQVQVMLAEALKSQAAFTLDAHFRLRPEVAGYHFQVVDGAINVSNYDPESRRYQIKSTHQSTPMDTGHWYQIEIRTAPDGTVRYSMDGAQLVQYVATDDLIADGVIRMGVSPNADVCFDNVKVTAP